MSEKSRIEWTDSTFNPWEGCAKVGPGCDHCYAESRNARFAGGTAVNWGHGAPRRRTSPANWRKPLAWEAAHAEFFAAHGRRQRVFCASLADVFDNAVDPSWREDLFALIRCTPNLDWLLLTKRIGNVPAMVSIISGWLPDNVWLGATIVNQAEADRDIPKLLAVPAHVRFLSMEPLLGPVTIRSWLTPHCERHPGPLESDGKCEVCEGRGIWGIADDAELQEHERAPIREGVDWVIAGGESGPNARPMHPDWALSLRDQCAAYGVPFLFKQWGEWREPAAGERYNTTMGRAQRVPAFIVSKTGTVHCFENDQTRDGGRTMLRVGKRAAGRLLDGRTHDEFPEAR
ncbi:MULTISPECIES: phage Gp37/Gp68 family protein [Burkholderia]|uniref:phage Gp37/Gp68 family protein n=1 Tax=Burkholderia TaxID=32008 RepID=UPI0006D3B791|nr:MULTISPECIES: phage Gp37/Gp68 family protein [Burkholderia]MBJ9731106.1 phage Gp37/Gp68 family protein [Burkholderia cenocepacia]